VKAVNLNRAMFNTFSGAAFNRARTHRHMLWRRWAGGPRACFICLNPSKADETTNDHTVTKMIGFATDLRCGAIDVVNVFDIITTYPSDLYAWFNEKEVSSVYNDGYILAAAKRAKRVICAWGNHGDFHLRARNVVKLLEKNNIETWCLRKNANGSPAHPLRLPYGLRPVRYYPGDIHA
jgi:hypothetical protein